jgi:hypothetical protein
MLAHARTRAAAVGRQATLPIYRWTSLLAVVAALALLIEACTPVPPAPLAGPDPADPGNRAPAVAYRSPVGPYVSRRPVEPSPWQDQNDRIAPAAKP